MNKFKVGDIVIRTHGFIGLSFVKAQLLVVTHVDGYGTIGIKRHLSGEQIGLKAAGWHPSYFSLAYRPTASKEEIEEDINKQTNKLRTDLIEAFHDSLVIAKKEIASPVLTNIGSVNYNPTPVEIHSTPNRRNVTVKWDDGTSTTVKASKGDKFSTYSGFTSALMKKIYGHTKPEKFNIIEHK